MRLTSYKLFFKALSNKTRFEIIQLLRKELLDVTSISKRLRFEQSRVSHNLKCLESCGFVVSRRDGKSKVYYLDNQHIIPILNEIDNTLNNTKKDLKDAEC
ncbi:transcriptional regulator [Candidatus Aerophobetes bacterium]|uniref:Transcriptional regulator n=1 Tax=Aerophobetes bacterium TaxID=2030807 RepID=A0A662DA49_UNCAE|nr:MAG: transcriptional regulator [Candidatus Aerophobetes bacterium]